MVTFKMLLPSLILRAARTCPLAFHLVHCITLDVDRHPNLAFFAAITLVRRGLGIRNRHRNHRPECTLNHRLFLSRRALWVLGTAPRVASCRADMDLAPPDHVLTIATAILVTLLFSV